MCNRTSILDDVNSNTTGVKCASKLLTLPEYLSSPLILVGFVLFDLTFSM